MCYNTATMSSSLKNLELQAINVAKKGNWLEAINFNKEIIQQNATDINALNRCGFAHLQLQQLDQACSYFQQVLKLEKSNAIAIKQLLNIKKNYFVKPQFNHQGFVEEPSKSTVINLHRLTNKQVLSSLAIGQELFLKIKNRFISIATSEQIYLGSLPEDISLRLSTLIKNGNQYSCHLHSFSPKHCDVFIKETYQSPTNRHYHSFDSNYQPGKDETIGEDLLLLTDEVPLNIIDDDSESTPNTPTPANEK